MKKVIILIIVFMSLVNAEIHIITSTSCEVVFLSKKDIKKLFMLKKKSINNEKILVLDSTNKELYSNFIVTYLNKSVRKIKTYWVRMLFTGKKIPPKKLSQEAINSLNDEGVCCLTYVEKIEDKPYNWKIIEVQ